MQSVILKDASGNSYADLVFSDSASVVSYEQKLINALLFSNNYCLDPSFYKKGVDWELLTSIQTNVEDFYIAYFTEYCLGFDFVKSVSLEAKSDNSARSFTLNIRAIFIDETSSDVQL